MMFNWAIFIITCLAMVGIGFWSSKKVGEDEGDEGFLLGGGNVGPFMGAAALVATGYSGWGFIGAPGTAYAYGTIEILANFLYGPAICFGTLWFADYLRKQAASRGGVTIPEYLSNVHHGEEGWKRAVHFIAGFSTLVFLMIYVVGQIKALGYSGSVWLGISEELASTLLMGIIVLIAIQGGRLGVAASNMVMAVGMVIAAIIVCAYVFLDIPFGELLTRLGEIDPQYLNPINSIPYGNSKYSVFLVFVYALLFTTCLPYMSSQFLTFSEDTKSSQVALIAAPMCAVLSFIPFVGIYMAVNHTGELANPDLAMPLFLDTYVNPYLGGIVTLFIIFAMLSTVSAVVQTMASALSYDMRKSLKVKEPKNSETVNRVAILIIGIIAIILTYLGPSGMLNAFSYLGTGGLITILFAPTICNILVKANAKVCFMSMLIGFISIVVLNLFTQVGWVEAPIIGALVSGVVYIIFGNMANGKSRLSE